MKGAPKSYHQHKWLSQTHLQPHLFHLLQDGATFHKQAGRPRSSRASNGRRLPPGSSQSDSFPQSVLTQPCMHAIALNTGSRMDPAQWFLAQRAGLGNVHATEPIASHRKGNLVFLMDVWQVFKFWAPSISDKNRLFAFVKLYGPFDFLCGPQGRACLGNLFPFVHILTEGFV